ncbi:MAG: hypothetical protein G01um10143_223 [Parcubacteria group bacterium Gr01-1014_3]|nr:MAG: hypothetical protein G01um10143_223 [Parcubacteria group bacterium Gr01-1014_3]
MSYDNLPSMNTDKKEFFSTSEVAQNLGISRTAVLKKITSGKLKAQKIGRNYVIHADDLPIKHGGKLTKEKKEIIDQAIKKTVKDYGEALKLLGKE